MPSRKPDSDQFPLDDEVEAHLASGEITLLPLETYSLADSPKQDDENLEVIKGRPVHLPGRSPFAAALAALEEMDTEVVLPGSEKDQERQVVLDLFKNVPTPPPTPAASQPLDLEFTLPTPDDTIDPIEPPDTIKEVKPEPSLLKKIFTSLARLFRR